MKLRQLPQKLKTIIHSYLIDTKPSAVTFSYHYFHAHVCTDRATYEEPPYFHWADLHAVIDLPVGYTGRINLSAAACDRDEWQLPSDGRRDVIVHLLNYEQAETTSTFGDGV